MNRWTKPRMEQDDASPKVLVIVAIVSILVGVALALIANKVKE